MVKRIATCNKEVRGLTSLNKELRVLCNDGKNQIKFYVMGDENDGLNNYLSLPGSLSVPGHHLWDMTSSAISQCMYISDYVGWKIYDVTLARHVTSWKLDYEPRGLSMLHNGNLLVTCRHPSALVELCLNDRTISNEIDLDKTITNPWHAVQLSTGNFAVCHGTELQKHRVCMVDRSGRIIRIFGSIQGSNKLKLRVPCHLAVDENDFIFVADCLNSRVTLLTPMLDFGCHVVEKMHSRPQCLYLDRDTKRLYVGQRNGDVLVIQL